MTTKILILAADIAEGREIIESLGIPRLYVMDEISIRQSTGFTMDPDLPGYSDKIIEKIGTLSNLYKADRPLAIIVNILHHSAVDRIPHDISCLIYDGSRNRRLNYNIRYQTDIKARDGNDPCLQELRSTIT